MLTWKIWRRLHQQPQHDPVFEHARRQHQLQQPNKLRFFLLFSLYVFGCLACTFIWPLFIHHGIAVIAALMALGHTLFGVVIAAATGTALARERERNTYDLLSVSPSGQMGISWSLSVGHLHATAFFNITRIAAVGLLLGGIITTLVALVLPLSLMQGRQADLALPLFGFFAVGALLMLSLYLDHIQSIVLATLCGLLAGSNTSNRLNARLYAGANFLLLKLTVYTILLYLAIHLLPDVFVLLFLALCLLVLCLLQEASARTIWLLLNRALSNTERFF